MHDNGQKRKDAGFLRKVGFTLAEILIALALIAVLAAVLLPSVAGQIMKGDAGRTMQDLNAIRAGVDQFLADVHRYPSEYDQLFTKILTTDADINGTTYPAGLVAKWSGPYVNRGLASGVLQTGFGATIQDGFTKVANVAPATGPFYVAIRIFGIDSAGFVRLDNDIDGASAWATARTTGLIRWNTAGGTDTTTYLAVPIQ